MFSVTQVGSINYYTSQKEHSIEYYSSSKDGKIGEIVDIGLRKNFEQKELSKEDLKNLAKEFSGKTRLGYDLTFSSPKEVSTLFAITKDENILKAHQEAVARTLQEIQKDVYVRDRSQEAQALNQIYKQAEGLFIRFDHFLNRNLEPQLHSHVLLFNQAKTIEDGKMRAVEPLKIYQNQKFYDALYKTELVKALREAGYDAKLEMKISETGEKFLDITFKNEKLSEFAKELSTRRQEVLEKAKELDGKIQADKAEVESIAAKATRQEKTHVDIEKIFSDLRQEFQEKYQISIDFLKQDIQREKEQGIVSSFESVKEVVKEAIQTLEKLESVNSFEKIIQTATEIASLRGVFVSSEALKNSIEDLKKEGYLKSYELSKQGMKEVFFSSKEQVNLEKENIQIVDSLKGKAEQLYQKEEIASLIKEFEAKKGFSLSSGQKEAIEKTLSTQDKILSWQGVAGAGKTTAMELVAQSMTQKGYEVVGLAPTGKAAEELSKSIGKADTVHSFLLNLEQMKEKFGFYHTTSAVKEHFEKIYSQYNSVFEQHKNLFAGDVQKLNLFKEHIKTETLASQFMNFLDRVIPNEFEKVRAYVFKENQILTKYDPKEQKAEIYIKNTKSGDITYLKYENKELTEQKAIYNPKDLITEKTTFVIDESSMLSSKISNELLKVIQNSGARAVFVGDISQLQSVEAGRFFQDIQTFSKAETARISEINRQKVESYRELTTALSRKDFEKAMEVLQSQGKITEVKSREELISHAVKDYVETTKAGMGVFIVTKTNETRAVLNEQVRAALKNENLLGKEERSFQVFQTKNLNPLEQKFAQFYTQNDVIRFNSFRDIQTVLKEQGIKTKVHEKEFQVVGVDQKTNSLIVQSMKNEKFQFKVELDKHHERFAVFEQKVIQLSVGDKIVTLQNDKEHKVKNGQLWEVKSIQGDKVILQAGKAIRELDLYRYKFIEHGYALTVHKSQGATVDKVIHVVDSKVNYNEVYVALTRGKMDYAVYTLDKNAYLNSIKQEQEKTSTVAFEEKASKQVKEFQERVKALQEKTKLSPEEQKAFVRNYLEMKDAISKHGSKELSLKNIEDKLQKFGIDQKIIKETWKEYMHERLQEKLSQSKKLTDLAKEIKITIREIQELKTDSRHESKTFEASKEAESEKTTAKTEKIDEFARTSNFEKGR